MVDYSRRLPARVAVWMELLEHWSLPQVLPFAPMHVLHGASERLALNRWTVCRAWSAHLSARPVGHCLAATMGLRPAASRSAGTRSSMIQDRPRPARSTPTTQQPRQLHQHTTSNSRLYVLLPNGAERVGGRNSLEQPQRPGWLAILADRGELAAKTVLKPT